MNNQDLEECSYSFLEWLFISGRGYVLSRPEGRRLLTENGEKCIEFLSHCGTVACVSIVILLALILTFLGIYFDLRSMTGFVVPIISVIIFLFLYGIPLWSYYLLLPHIGIESHHFGYINENELQIFLKHRVPYSIFRDPKHAPQPWWKRKKVEQIKDNGDSESANPMR